MAIQGAALGWGGEKIGFEADEVFGLVQQRTTQTVQIMLAGGEEQGLASGGGIWVE
jgi:hypothetical protein